MSFSGIDIVFVVIILAFAFTAWRHGFVGEVLGKIAPVVSILVAALFFADLAPTVVKLVAVPAALSAVIAFIVLFVATFIVIKLVQVVLSGIINSLDVLKLNSLLGLVLGVLEGLIVVSAIMIVLLVLPWEKGHALVHASFAWSLLGSLLQSPANRVQQFLQDATKTVQEAV